MLPSKQSQRGFSVIEMIIYVALVAIVGTVLTLFVSQLIKRSSHAQLTAQVLNNARRTTAIMAFEIRHAKAVYDPTSAFGSDPGQLALVTTQNLPAGEDVTYVDFYVDDERLYRKREGQAAELLMSERTRVDKLVFTYLNQASEQPAIRIEMTVTPDTTASEALAQTSVTLFATASLRSY